VHYAAAHGHLNILEHLSTKGVDLDVDDAQGRSALHYAALGEGRARIMPSALGCGPA
jgi:ankyrin repeat protein